MDQVRIGVIGTGRMGASHCRVYSNMRHAKFVGVCDVNADLGKDVAKRYDVSFFRDVDSLLENVDAVSICTPTPDHFEIDREKWTIRKKEISTQTVMLTKEKGVTKYALPCWS